MYDEPFAGLDPISMGVTANLIRNLNDTLGSTGDPRVARRERNLQHRRLCVFPVRRQDRRPGTPDEMRRSTDPYVKQFVNAEPDGPVPSTIPGKSLADDLGLGGKR
jgi:phospholipid/cholesterol/gamma-HCH transport system ATP-binding protein